MIPPKEKAAEKLKERNFKLNTLLEVSSAINNLEEEIELYEYFKDVLINKLSLGKGILLSDNKGWSVNIIFGTNIDSEDHLIEICRDFTRITVLNNYNKDVLADFDVIIPIFHKTRPLSYLLLADFEGERIEVSPIIRHLPFIQTITNLIVVAQENRRLFESNIEKAALQKELELASRMQNMLIPKHMPERGDLDIFALYKPHQVVGGDYYDFFQVSAHETVFCIADVSGKGISAAMLMSNFQAMMQAMLHHDRNLNNVVTVLNERVVKNAKGEKFVTAFIGIYNHNEHILTYVNCGHLPPIVCNNGSIVELSEGCPVLGAVDKLPHLKVGRQKLSSGDAMVCFTDGICEVEDESKNEFGTGKIKEILVNGLGSSSEILVDKVMNEIQLFKGERDFPDDLALLAVRFTY